MLDVAPLTDSTPIIRDAEAIRRRWEEDGALFFRGVIDVDLLKWAQERYRDALAAEDLIDPAVERPVWTGKPPKSRRPCDAIGTEVWHEIVKQPRLNAIMRDIFDGEPVWIPIVAHRSGLPTGPVPDDADVFVGRHQDGFYNEGMQFSICWMPIRDVALDAGSFAVAPGTHKRGFLHSDLHDDYSIPDDVIADDAWRAADYKVGDVLIFNYMTAHSALPNPSDEIRMSLDVRAVPDWAPQPVIGVVDDVRDCKVDIRTDGGELVTVEVSDETFIRDVNPRPRVATRDLPRIAHAGARVMAMARTDGTATVLRRNAY